jgi:hypothetical protein
MIQCFYSKAADHMQKNRDTMERRNCCIEGIERKGNKEDIAFITLARSLVTSQKLAKEMRETEVP